MAEMDLKKVGVVLGGGTLDNNTDIKQSTTSMARRSTQTDKEKSPSSRWHRIVTYIPPQYIDECLRYNSSWIKAWATAYHDRDLEGDGTPKQPHTHILLYTYNYKSSSAVKKDFDKYAKYLAKKLQDAGDENATPQNTLTKIADYPVSYFAYLLHENDPDKYRYEPSVRKVSDPSWWKSYDESGGKSTNIALQIFDSLQEGMTTRDLLVNYGCEYAHNHNRYKELLQNFDYENHVRETATKQCDAFEQLISETIIETLENSPFSDQSKREFKEIYNYITKKNTN